MITDDEITTLATEAMRQRVDQLALTGPEPDELFEPERRPLTLVVDDRGGRRPRARIAVAAAAVVATAAAIVVATVIRPPDDDSSGVGTRPGPDVTVPPAPEGLPLPTRTPAGMTLWGVSWSSEEPSGASARWGQLFATADGGSLLVETYPKSLTRTFDVGTPGDDAPVVRGHRASVELPPFTDSASGARALYWFDGETVFAASFLGMSESEAASAVNQLSPRPGSAVGFDAPPGGPLTLSAEVLDPPTPSPLTADFTYYGDANPGEHSTLSLHTSPAVGGRTVGYLRTWFLGDRDAAGVVRTRFDGSLMVARPDGSSVLADWSIPMPPELSDEIVEQVVTSAQPASADQLRATQAGIGDRVATLPLLATATLPTGRVEVRGPDVPWALCLRVGASTTCPPTVRPEGPDELASGLVVGSTWYVVVASRVSTWQVQEHEGQPLLHGDTGSSGTWHFEVLQPGADIDSVNVDFDHDHGYTLTRP
jgi:hypothetical protein